jgi:Uma2 family endonuclease
VASRRGLPSSASLVIEVADSSRSYDLGVKARLYARAGIPDYWVVDPRKDRIVVHREPSPPGYRDLTPVSRGVVTAPRHPSVRVDVDQLLTSP